MGKKQNLLRARNSTKDTCIPAAIHFNEFSYTCTVHCKQRTICTSNWNVSKSYSFFNLTISVIFRKFYGFFRFFLEFAEYFTLKNNKLYLHS